MTQGAFWLSVLAAALAAACAATPVRRVPALADPPPARSRQDGVGDLARLRPVLSSAAGLGVWSVVGGVPGVVLGPVAAGVVWRAVGRMEPAAERRRRAALHRALPHAVDLMAAALAAGASPSSAVRLVADAVDPPLDAELRLVGVRLEWGMAPVQVWADVARHPQLAPLGRTLGRATETGSSVLEAMLQLAESLRQDAQTEVESRARAVGVRAAAPLGLCLLPAFVLVGVVPLVAGSMTALLGL